MEKECDPKCFQTSAALYLGLAFFFPYSLKGRTCGIWTFPGYGLRIRAAAVSLHDGLTDARPVLCL